MKLVLLNYWRSSASHRVRIGLGLKGRAFEYVAINLLHHEQQAEGYRAKNPMAQVPTLAITEDDGTTRSLTQSLAILEYLDERWPEPALLPRDVYLRARVRALAEIVNAGIQPHQNLVTMKRVKTAGADEKAWPVPFIAEGLAAYARTCADVAGKFSVGDTPTIADCCLIPQLGAARRFNVDYAQHEVLGRIEQSCMALPAFANAAPETQPDAVKS
jgi:maleylpyruvate isomerase